MNIGEAIRRARLCPCEQCEAWAIELEEMYRKEKGENEMLKERLKLAVFPTPISKP